jgi:hypothetical protein
VPTVEVNQEGLMSKAIPIVFLSALSFVFFLGVGQACGTGYREKGSFAGCKDEVVRQWGVLRDAGSSSNTSSFSDASSAGSSSAPGRAIVAGGSAANQGTWRQVTYWVGRGNKDTENFVIARPEWRITWSAKSAASAGTLRISVVDGSDQSVAVVVDSNQPVGESTPVAKGPGRYRLKIESANVDWNVQVEEGSS